MPNSRTMYTQLINSMVGLLIIPEQRYFLKITDGIISEELFLSVRECISCYTYEKDVKNLQDISRHMRNAVAHSRIDFCYQNRKIQSVILKDEDGKGRFEINIPIDLLRQFLLSYSDAVAEL